MKDKQSRDFYLLMKATENETIIYAQKIRFRKTTETNCLISL